MTQERTNKEMNVMKMKPFNNNPSLPQTQRYRGKGFPSERCVLIG